MVLSQHLDDALCRDFPKVFRDRHGDWHRTLMALGFECGGGWEPLIRRCAAALEAYAETLPPDEWPRVLQVKEKFGGLRFYVAGNVSKEASDVIETAQQESELTCEICGAPAKQVEMDRWWLTRCGVHFHMERAKRTSWMRN